MLLASVVSRTKYFSYLTNRKRRLGAIDGIRGYLALSVLFHHYVVTYYWKLGGIWQRPPENFFQNLGKVGVAIFFMITGFLFFSRIMDKNRVINWLSLYKSRLFRIYPLYLFSLALISLIVFYSSDFRLNTSKVDLILHYIRWGIFIGGDINDFSDTKKIIAGVDWTLKYEWLFYLSLPLIFLTNRFLGKVGLISLGLFSIYVYVYPFNIKSFSSIHLIYFAVGAVAFPLSRLIRTHINCSSFKVSILSVALIVILFLYPKTHDPFHVLVMAIFFILISAGNNIFGMLSSKTSLLLGEISYSIYLLHGIVLYLIFTCWSPLEVSKFTLAEFILFLPLISLVVVIISVLTFLVIENPAIKMGKALRLKKRKSVNNVA